jgi:hypothetical protein
VAGLAAWRFDVPVVFRVSWSEEAIRQSIVVVDGLFELIAVTKLADSGVNDSMAVHLFNPSVMGWPKGHLIIELATLDVEIAAELGLQISDDFAASISTAFHGPPWTAELNQLG